MLERAGRALLDAHADAGGADHARQPRHGAVRAGPPTVHIPIFGSDQIADVTGAGDTVIATMTLALAAGATFEEAAHLANYAGGLVVMKRGTATRQRRRAAHAISGGTMAVTHAWAHLSPRTSWSARVPRDRAARAHASRSPTAASTCCTSATSATSGRGARKPIG